jgi:hypothetical protein
MIQVAYFYLYAQFKNAKKQLLALIFCDFELFWNQKRPEIFEFHQKFNKFEIHKKRSQTIQRNACKLFVSASTPKSSIFCLFKCWISSNWLLFFCGFLNWIGVDFVMTLCGFWRGLKFKEWVWGFGLKFAEFVDFWVGNW